MSRFIILLGGKLVRTPRLDAQVAGARVIAADAGMNHAKTLGHHAGALGRRLRFRARTNSRPSSRPSRRTAIRRTRTRPTASLPSPRRCRAARRRWCLPALSAGAGRPCLPACCAGDPAREGRTAGHHHQRQSGSPSAAARLARLRLRGWHAVQHPRLLAPFWRVRYGRQMAARQRRGAIRLVADPLQRSARRPAHLARRWPRGAPCPPISG